MPSPSRLSSTLACLPVELSFCLLASMHLSFWNLSQLLLALSAVDMNNELLLSLLQTVFDIHEDSYHAFPSLPFCWLISPASLSLPPKEVFSRVVTVLVCSPLGFLFLEDIFLKVSCPKQDTVFPWSHLMLGRVERSYYVFRFLGLHDICLFHNVRMMLM